MLIDLTNKFNRPAQVEIQVVFDEVAFILDHVVMGVWRRQYLYDWLNQPQHEIANQAITFLAIPNGIALAIDDVVHMWPLTDATLLHLIDMVEPEAKKTTRAARLRRNAHV